MQSTFKSNFFFVLQLVQIYFWPWGILRDNLECVIVAWAQIACSRRSDSSAREKNSRRKKKRRKFNSLPTDCHAVLSECLEQARAQSEHEQTAKQQGKHVWGKTHANYLDGICVRYKTNLQIQDCLDTHKKPNQIFQPRRISLVFGSSRFAAAGAGAGAEVTQWGWGSIASLRLHFASDCSYFPRLQCSHNCWLKDTWESLETGELFCKITLCLISFSSLGI